MKHITAISDLDIRVETKFDAYRSDPSKQYYFFTYFISITNTGPRSLKLLYRKWEILDSIGDFREVEGQGVIGLQPILEPGQTFSYESSCHFASDFGQMQGYYFFQDIHTHENFLTEIPLFEMYVPWKWN